MYVLFCVNKDIIIITKTANHTLIISNECDEQIQIRFLTAYSTQ